MSQLITAQKPASDKQIRYIVDLADKRTFQGHVSSAVLNTVLRARVRMSPPKFVAPPFVAASDASVAIDALLHCRPHIVTPTVSDAQRDLVRLLSQIRPGRYALPRHKDGVVDAFEVVERKNGRRYLNQLLGGSVAGTKFHRKTLTTELQAAAARAVLDDQTAAAKLFAATYTECPRCGVALTHPRSRTAGIGQRCADEWGWTW